MCNVEAYKYICVFGAKRGKRLGEASPFPAFLSIIHILPICFDSAQVLYIGSSTLNVSIYSENRRCIYFNPQKRLNHGRQNITFHWINGIIRNNKCIFTKLNAVFIPKTAAWTKTILQRLFPSQIPDRFSKLLCSTAVP
jgi:hypothetical protein